MPDVEMADVAILEVEYGVPIHGVPPADAELQAVTAVIAPTAVQAYPNPCGTWCDVGNLRDVWWAAVWIVAMASVIGSGLHTAATVTFFPPSTGTAKVIRNSGWAVEGAPTDFGCYRIRLDRDEFIAMGCSGGDFYLGNFDEIPCPGNSHSERQAALRNAVAAKAPNVVKVPSLPHFTVMIDHVNFTVEFNTCRKDEYLPDLGESKTYGLLVMAVLLSIVLGIAVVCLMRAAPRAAILVLTVGLPIMPLAFGIWCVIDKSYIFAVGSFVSFSAWSLFLCGLRGSFPYAAMCLQMSSHVVLHHWGTLVTAVVAQSTHAAFIVVWLFSVRNLDRLEASNPLLWGLVLVLYWGTEVFRNVVYVTTSGVTSDWFFSEYQGTRRASVTLGAAKRAAVWSLGSICFGSLLVAIIRMVHSFVQYLMLFGGRIGRCLLRCVLSCIESVMRYFNDYAFVQVAMFGKPYTTAAKDTWALVKKDRRKGWEAVVGLSLLDHIFGILALSGAALVGLALYVVSGSPMWGIVGGVIGYMVVSIVARQVYSGMMTVFIGFWQLQAQGVTWQPPSVGAYTPSEEFALLLKTCYDIRDAEEAVPDEAVE